MSGSHRIVPDLPQQPAQETPTAGAGEPASIGDTIAPGASFPLAGMSFLQDFPGPVFLSLGIAPAAMPLEAAGRVAGSASDGSGFSVAFVDATLPRSGVPGAGDLFAPVAQPNVSLAGAAGMAGAADQAAGMLGDFSTGIGAGVAGGAMQPTGPAAGAQASGDANLQPIGVPFTLTG